MVPLLIVAAFAIDLGLLVNERRNAQIAADHAALAAAWASCHGEDPEDAATELAEANDEGGSFTSVNVSPEGDGYYVRVSSSIDSAFAGIIGIDSLSTEAEATAECRDIFHGIPAMFAGSETSTCPALDWSGSDGLATGDVHSNGDLDVTGNDNSVSGEVTYVDDEKVSPGSQDGINVSPGEPETDPLEDRVTLSSYAPSGDKWIEATAAGQNRNPSGTGNIRIRNSDPLLPGLYYTTGNISVEKNNVPSTAVTFVSSGGTITFGGTNQTFTPWDTENSLLAFSNRTGGCTDPVLSLVGTGGTWAGIFYAPNGKIRISGSNNGSYLSGALVGAMIDVQGREFTVDATALQGEPIQTVRLTK